MNTEKQSLPNLVVSRDKASEKIQTRIAKGEELRDLPIRSEPELEETRDEYFKWSKYNSRLLSRLFDNLSIEKEYSSDLGFSVGGLTLEQEIRHYRRDVTGKIHRLESILEGLELIPERIPDSPPFPLRNKPLPIATRYSSSTDTIRGPNTRLKGS